MQSRTRLLAHAWGEREITVRLLLGAALLLVLLTALALTLLALAPQVVLGAQGGNAGSARVLQAFVGLVQWLSLMVLFGAAWTTGAFDRMLRSRKAQAACITALVTAAVWIGASAVAVVAA